MPTKKPRITITLEPHTHEVLSRLSAASGDSMSQIVSEYIEVAVPALERVVVVLERAKAAPAEARDGFAAAIGRTDRAVIAALGTVDGQMDWLLNVAEAALPAAAEPLPKRAEVPRLKGSTPVPVTRGSGGGKTRRQGGSDGTL
jgi:hypothetical protein